MDRPRDVGREALVTDQRILFLLLSCLVRSNSLHEQPLFHHGVILEVGGRGEGVARVESSIHALHPSLVHHLRPVDGGGESEWG